MTFNFAKFLLNQTKMCNGHLQSEASGITFEEGLEICKELEEYTNNQYAFTLEVWTCGSFSIYQQDFWKPGEHVLGHTERLILGVSP